MTIHTNYEGLVSFGLVSLVNWISTFIGNLKTKLSLQNSKGAILPMAGSGWIKELIPFLNGFESKRNNKPVFRTWF